MADVVKWWPPAETGRADGRRPNKYHARRCACSQGGQPHTHDSLAERARCWVLHQRQAAGEISGLAVHAPRYPFDVQGQRIGYYTPDFTYWTGRDAGYGPLVVEDVKAKPTRTRDYVLRKKLLRALYGIDIVEVG